MNTFVQIYHMTFKSIIVLGFLILTISLNQSCKNNDKQTLLGIICDTTDTKFSSVINPFITSKCVSCHNNASQSGGINLEGYNNVKANYAGIIETCKDGSMPQGGSRVDDCTITKIETWVNRGAQNN